MADTYYLNLNGTEAGPFTKRQLEAMWLTGGITVNTQWRSASSNLLKRGWGDGARLPEMLEGSDLKLGLQPSVHRRVILRKQTEYPILRQCVLALLILAGVCLLISTLGLFNSDTRLLGVAGIAASLGSAFSACILGVLLDLADASLRKLD